jgi:hypothetical protein
MSTTITPQDTNGADHAAPDSTVRNCLICLGEKTTGKGGLKCMACSGTGTFKQPDVVQLYHLVRGHKGLRQNQPKNARAAYIWRMIRFHAGVDTSLPTELEYLRQTDPWVELLDVVAEHLAMRWYGDNTAGVRRWGPVLGLTEPENTDGA